VRIGIKIDGDFFFEGGIEFFSQCLNKIRYPPFRSVIFLAVADENIIFVTCEIEAISQK
jgi:hypothetical protein